MDNISLIAKALQEYSDCGYTAVDNEVAEYVLLVLNGLKCSFDVNKDPHTYVTYIIDRM